MTASIFARPPFGIARSVCLAAWILTCTFVAAPPSTAADAPTNVVVIFIDDMGYGDIGPFGATDYPTPNLDRMAAEGRRFTDFVVSSAVCSASRSAIMTGCLHRRIGIAGALGPASKIGINADEVTLAEICKSQGYDTACFGKWHLGHHHKFLPVQHGFDEYFGIPYSNDMWPLHPAVVEKRKKNPNAKSNWPPLPLLEGTAESGVRVVNADVQPADQETFTQAFTQRAVEFIRRERDNGFFVYLPHPMVHVPLYVSDDFKGKSGAGLFGDVVMEVDWSVGQIMEAVESIGQTENTLIVFTSDNGPWLSYGDHAGTAGPLREGKGTMWEGGYREPTVMRMPGTIPGGTTCEQLAATVDLLPTVAAMIGAELPDHKIDGKDIQGLMTGTSDQSPHQYYPCYYKGGELQAIRNERFKLVFPHNYRTMAGKPGGTGGFPNAYSSRKSGLELYDLDSDVGETNNVIEDHPDVVAQLQRAAQAVRDDLGDKLTGHKGSGIRPAGRMTESDQPLVW
ncbi:sulfatase family protein [Crateriforma conspicua]|uniref:sulfatase family protein n=1 Tax=Crateriforma conspicua TaxID=2527996 RepID=UPI00118A0141|nr:sulfatase [Crateriforma conspicua]QDV61328.1 Arylsulfatase [Crateriforma conspicua]